MTANRTRSSASKTTTKKAAATKSATKKSARKSASKPAASSKPSKSASSGGPTSNGHSRHGDAPRAASSPRLGAVELAGRAAQQLAELTGRATEGVTRLERTDDGWTVELEVLELRRIPETTDVLATYEAKVDDRGRLESYQRLSRYVRGAAGKDRS